MRTLSFIYLALASITTFATADHCPNITLSEAQNFVDRFITLIGRTGDWETTAREILCEDFTLVSNALLSLDSSPLGNGTLYGVAATNRTAYLTALSSWNASNITSTRPLILGACGEVVWSANFGRIGPVDYPSRAVGILSLRRDGGRVRAERYEAEFDSVGAGRGLGLDCGGCSRRGVEGYGD